MKYLVVECHKGYAVLLDENASFVNSANLGYEVGQTVFDPILMDSGKIGTNRRISRLLAAAACLVLVSGIFLYRRNHAVYSEITISDNVCMQVNRKGEVITVESLNGEGEKILENYQAEGKNQLDATEEIIKKAIETGSIQDGDTVSLYVDTPEQDSFFDCKTEFEEHFRSKHGFKVNIKKYNNKNSTKNHVSATSAPASQENTVPYTPQENTAPPQENVTPPQENTAPENTAPYTPQENTAPENIIPYEQDPDINSQEENFSDFNNDTHEKNRNFSDLNKNNESRSDSPDRNQGRNNENYNNYDNHDNHDSDNNFSDFNNDTNENYDNFYDSDKNNYRENQNQDFNQDFSPEYQENQGHHGGHSR